MDTSTKKSTSFVATCMSYFGEDRRVTGDEFIKLSQQDRVELHQGFMSAGITCDAPGAGSR